MSTKKTYTVRIVRTQTAYLEVTTPLGPDDAEDIAESIIEYPGQTKDWEWTDDEYNVQDVYEPGEDYKNE